MSGDNGATAMEPLTKLRKQGENLCDQDTTNQTLDTARPPRANNQDLESRDRIAIEMVNTLLNELVYKIIPENNVHLDKTSETDDKLNKTSETDDTLDKTSETDDTLDKTSETDDTLDKTSETDDTLDKTSETDDKLDKPSETDNKLDKTKDKMQNNCDYKGVALSKDINISNSANSKISGRTNIDTDDTVVKHDGDTVQPDETQNGGDWFSFTRSKLGKYKTALLPIAGGLAGALIGGPLGAVAGFKLSGVAVVGAVAGVAGGTILEEQTQHAAAQLNDDDDDADCSITSSNVDTDDISEPMRQDHGTSRVSSTNHTVHTGAQRNVGQSADEQYKMAVSVLMGEMSINLSSGDTEIATSTLNSAAEITPSTPIGPTEMATGASGQVTEISVSTPDDVKNVTTSIHVDVTEMATSMPGKVTEMTTSTPGKVTEMTTSTPGKVTEMTTSTPGKVTEITTSTPGKVTEMTTSTPGNVTEITTSTPADVTEMTTSTPADVTEMTTSTPADVTEMTTSTPADVTEITTSTHDDVTEMTTSTSADSTEMVTSRPAVVTEMTTSTPNDATEMTTSTSIIATRTVDNTPNDMRTKTGETFPEASIDVCVAESDGKSDSYLSKMGNFKKVLFPAAGAVVGAMMAGPVGFVTGLKLGSAAVVGGSIAGASVQVLMENKDKQDQFNTQQPESTHNKQIHAAASVTEEPNTRCDTNACTEDVDNYINCAKERDQSVGLNSNIDIYLPNSTNGDTESGGINNETTVNMKQSRDVKPKHSRDVKAKQSRDVNKTENTSRLPSKANKTITKQSQGQNFKATVNDYFSLMSNSFYNFISEPNEIDGSADETIENANVTARNDGKRPRDNTNNNEMVKQTNDSSDNVNTTDTSSALNDGIDSTPCKVEMDGDPRGDEIEQDEMRAWNPEINLVLNDHFLIEEDGAHVNTNENVDANNDDVNNGNLDGNCNDDGNNDNNDNNDNWLLSQLSMKSMIYPVAGALAGTLIAGPVGLVAGLKLGSLTVVSGGIVGFTGGKIVEATEQRQQPPPPTLDANPMNSLL